jgi:hypothetical protein
LPATTSTKRKGIANLVGLAHRRCSVPTSCSPIATRFQRGASLRSLRTRQKWAQQLALRCRCLRLTASRALPPVVCAPSNHGWAGIQGRDDAAITPTLGPGRRQAWACAQSVGVGRIGGGSFGSNLGSPVRVGGSTRLHYCNQGHAASGSGFGCPSRAGPGGSPGTESSRPRSLKRFPADLNRWDSQRVMDERVFGH